MGHGGNVVVELTTDHREVDSLFAQIEAQPVGAKQRRELADDLTVELVRHSVAEEEYLYPAVRRYVDGGDDLADKELEDHAGVERLLKDLEGREADDDQFNHLIAKLKLEVSAHVRDEENRLFPSSKPPALPKRSMISETRSARRRRLPPPGPTHPRRPPRPRTRSSPPAPDSSTAHATSSPAATTDLLAGSGPLGGQPRTAFSSGRTARVVTSHTPWPGSPSGGVRSGGGGSGRPQSVKRLALFRLPRFTRHMRRRRPAVFLGRFGSERLEAAKVYSPLPRADAPWPFGCRKGSPAGSASVRRVPPRRHKDQM